MRSCAAAVSLDWSPWARISSGHRVGIWLRFLPEVESVPPLMLMVRGPSVRETSAFAHLPAHLNAARPAWGALFPWPCGASARGCRPRLLADAPSGLQKTAAGALGSPEGASANSLGRQPRAEAPVKCHGGRKI